MDWQTILENIPDLLLVLKEDGTIVRASQGFETYMGFEPEELIDTDIEDLFGDGEMLAMLGIDSVFEDEDEISDLTLLFRNAKDESVGCLTSGRRVKMDGEDYFVLVSRPHGETQEALAQSSREAAEEREQRAVLEQILNTLVDAVFMVDESFTVQPLFSKSCERIFGIDNLEGSDANKLLFGHFDEADETYQMHLAAIATTFGEEEFAWYFNDHVFIDQVEYTPPNAAENTKPRVLQLRYAPLVNDEDLIHRVLFIVSDVTELRALEAAAANASRKASVVIALSEGDQQVREMFFEAEGARIQEIQGYYEQACQAGAFSDNIRVLIMRALHTIKGNSKLLKFEELASLAHIAENDVIEAEVAEDLPPIGEKLEALDTHFQEICNIREQIGGADKTEGQGKAALQLLTEVLDTSLDEQPFEMLANIRSLLAGALGQENVSLLRTLSPLSPMAGQVAERLGKQVELSLPPGSRNEVYLASPIAQAVLDAMTHGLRNAVDHGIEMPDIREQGGKSVVGSIRISLTYDSASGSLELTIEDDGAGINLDALEEKGRARGLLEEGVTPTQEQLRNLVFESGFSTRDVATEISGRGVGLDAARNRLREIGGDIMLNDNDSGVGSRFVVRIPSRHLEVAYVGGRVIRGMR